MKYAKLTLVCILITLMNSCTPAGYLTKRYKSVDVIHNKDSINRFIQVSAYVMPKESEEKAPKTIFDLSPKAQAALIEELGKKDSTSVKLFSDLTASLSTKPTSNSEIIDYTKINRKIVISVSELQPYSADRIERINIKLQFDDQLKIVGCNKLATEYQTIDFGKLNYSASQGLEANGSLSSSVGSESTSSDKTSITGTSAGIAGKYTANRSFAEEVLLKQRIVALNASIERNTLSLYQQGVSGIDLDGNIIADVTFKIDSADVRKVYTFSNLYKNDVLQDSGSIKVVEKRLIIPNIKDDLLATISFAADYRHVVKKAETISESDDHIQLYSDTVYGSKQIITVSMEDLKIKIWKLSIIKDNTETPILIQGPGGKGDLLFDSYSDAQAFLNWAKEKYENKTGAIILGNKKYSILIPENSSALALTILPFNF